MTDEAGAAIDNRFRLLSGFALCQGAFWGAFVYLNVVQPLPGTESPLMYSALGTLCSGGYVALVGVVRDWRRRGVAPAMLAEVMRAARAAGHERIALDVDSENPTGALGLYTGMGFVATSRSVAHVEEL